MLAYLKTVNKEVREARKAKHLLKLAVMDWIEENYRQPVKMKVSTERIFPVEITTFTAVTSLRQFQYCVVKVYTHGGHNFEIQFHTFSNAGEPPMYVNEALADYCQCVRRAV